jgi:hypothetical protein
MYRANQFPMNFIIWSVLAGILIVYTGFVSQDKVNYYAFRYRILSVKWKAMLAMLQLRQRHLYEQVVIRYIGLKAGILIRETTIGLAFKVAAYLFIRTLNLLLQ